MDSFDKWMQPMPSNAFITIGNKRSCSSQRQQGDQKKTLYG